MYVGCDRLVAANIYKVSVEYNGSLTMDRQLAKCNDPYNKNPYWDLYKNENTSAKDVFRLTGKAIWNITDHLKLQGTIGTDMNFLDFQDYIARTTPGKLAGQLSQQRPSTPIPSPIPRPTRL